MLKRRWLIRVWVRVTVRVGVKRPNPNSLTSNPNFEVAMLEADRRLLEENLIVMQEQLDYSNRRRYANSKS